MPLCRTLLFRSIIKTHFGEFNIKTDTCWSFLHTQSPPVGLIESLLGRLYNSGFWESRRPNSNFKMAGQASQASSPGATDNVKSPSTAIPGFNRDKCLFCRVVDGKDSTSSSRIIYEDEELVVFPDIHPAAKNHFLVVTKAHIKDAKSLSTSQIDLLDRLVQTGTKVLTDTLAKEGEIVDDAQLRSKTLMGFHWPPFHTVSHLHLHVISPSDQIGFIGRIIFRPNSYWFVQPEWVKERLEKMKDAQES